MKKEEIFNPLIIGTTVYQEVFPIFHKKRILKLMLRDTKI